MSRRTQPRAGFIPVNTKPGPRTTQKKKCTVVLNPGASGLPIRCEDERYKAGRCIEHWKDWKNARESRQGAEAVNPERREQRALGLSGRQLRKRRKAERRNRA